MITIYTDGSHLKKTTGRLGCGGIIVRDGKQISSYKQQITPEFLQLTYGTSDCSNPTAELLGVLLALVRFSSILKKYPEDEIVFKADYMGVSAWCKGTWKIKEKYIQAIKNDIDKELKKQKLHDRVSFDWIKGHENPKTSQDAYWNNEVDKLAKGI